MALPHALRIFGAPTSEEDPLTAPKGYIIEGAAGLSLEQGSPEPNSRTTVAAPPGFEHEVPVDSLNFDAWSSPPLLHGISGGTPPHGVGAMGGVGCQALQMPTSSPAAVEPLSAGLPPNLMASKWQEIMHGMASQQDWCSFGGFLDNETTVNGTPCEPLLWSGYATEQDGTPWGMSICSGWWAPGGVGRAALAYGSGGGAYPNTAPDYTKQLKHATKSKAALVGRKAWHIPQAAGTQHTAWPAEDMVWQPQATRRQAAIEFDVYQVESLEPNIAAASDEVAEQEASCESGSESTTAGGSDFKEGDTTVMFRNLPEGYTRKVLEDLLNQEGFAARYNFIYVPVNLSTGRLFYYAFINLVTPEDTREFVRHFNGFSGWPTTSDQVGVTERSVKIQGIGNVIERYRNSPIMHSAVPEIYKPGYWVSGCRLPFPRPTKRLKAPRLHRHRARDIA